MQKVYDTVSIFSILLISSILLSFLGNRGSDSSVISYNTIFKYALIIIVAMVIFEGVQCLPVRNAILVYITTSTLITLETVFLECVVWDWMNLTFFNVCLLSLWVFITCGIITLGFIKKNIADAKLINQRIERWKNALGNENGTQGHE